MDKKWIIWCEARENGESTQLDIEYATARLEPAFYTPGTVAELMALGDGFTLQSVSFFYHFIPAE